jgi:hypothetical protein
LVIQPLPGKTGEARVYGVRFDPEEVLAIPQAVTPSGEPSLEELREASMRRLLAPSEPFRLGPPNVEPRHISELERRLADLEADRSGANARIRFDSALAGGSAAAGPFIDAPILLPASHAMARAAGEASPTRKRENPVTVSEIKAWHRTLSRAEKSLGVTALWERARSAHPGRHLPRKMVEPYGKSRGTGHRAKLR